MTAFDDLIHHLLNHVALSGSQGLDAKQFEQAVHQYYAADAPSAATAPSAPRDAAVDLFSAAPPAAQATVDAQMVECAWKWLCEHPEVHLQHVDGHHGPPTPPSATTSAPSLPPPSSVEARLAGKRLFTTQDRVWHTLTGHGIDYSRVQRLDFDILSVVAAHGPAGVLQPVVTKLTGQDKRSVPARTDRLAQKGYIVKETVVGSGTRTSLLKWAKFAEQQAHVVMNQPGQRGEGRPVVYHERWLDTMIRMLRENNNIMTMPDIWLGLEIADRDRLGKRQLARCLRRLAEVGCVRRVTARVLGRDGKPLTTSTHGHERTAYAIQLLREAGDLDRMVWMKNSALPRTAAQSEDDDDDDGYGGDDTFEETNDPVTARDDGKSALARDDAGPTRLGRTEDRLPPRWRPDIPLPNLIREVVQRAGEDGVTSTDLTHRVTGLAYRRPMEEITTQLTDAWQESQPPHLRHLGMTRASVRGKQAHYRYRTVENYDKAQGSEGKWVGARSQGDYDEWGFPKVALKQLAGRDGRATLAEGRKSVIVEAMQNHDDHVIVQEEVAGTSRAPVSRKSKFATTNKSATPNKKSNARRKKPANSAAGRIALPADAQAPPQAASALRRAPPIPRSNGIHTSGEEVATGEPIESDAALFPVRVPPAPYGVRQRASSTVLHVAALLDSTPETEDPTKENTPQPAATQRRKLGRRSMLGQPDVPVVRTRQIKEEEYAEFDRWAQAEAQRRVTRELRSTPSTAAQPDGRAQSDPTLDQTSRGATAEPNGNQSTEGYTELPQDRVAEIKAHLLLKQQPGVYVNPPGARKLKAETVVSRGRPRKALIAVVKSDRLRDFAWFQADTTPRFAPISGRKRTAHMGHAHAYANHRGQFSIDFESPPRKRQRRQSGANASTGLDDSMTIEETSMDLSQRVDNQAFTAQTAIPLQQHDMDGNPSFNGSIQPANVASVRTTEVSRDNLDIAGNVAPLSAVTGPQSPMDGDLDVTGFDVAGAEARLEGLHSSGGRKSQITPAELAKLQKQLAKAPLSTSPAIQPQNSDSFLPRPVLVGATRIQHESISTTPPDDAVPVNAKVASSNDSSAAKQATEELAELSNAPGRKTTEVLDQTNFGQQKINTHPVPGPGPSASLVEQLRDQPGRKTPEMPARMADMEQNIGRDHGEQPAESPTTGLAPAPPALDLSPLDQAQDLQQKWQMLGTRRPPQAPPDVEGPSWNFAGTRELYTTAYVKTHPKENFHHVGRGRWAPGCPPPGTIQKTKARGPTGNDYTLRSSPDNSSADRQSSAEEPPDSLVAELPGAWGPQQQSEAQLPPPNLPSVENVESRRPSVSAPGENSAEAMQAPVILAQDKSIAEIELSPLEPCHETAKLLPSAKSRRGVEAAAERESIILNAVNLCKGVFPGDQEMWFVCATAWREAHDGQTPDRVTIETAVQKLIVKGKLKKYQFSVAAEKGARFIKHLLIEPGVDIASPTVLAMQRQMTLLHPKLHLPADVNISDELRHDANSKYRREKKQKFVPDITVQQSVAAAAEEDRLAALKGFADAQAMRLHTQQRYKHRWSNGAYGPKPSRLSVLSFDSDGEESSDTDDDEEEGDLSLDAEQRALQGQMQIEGYQHDLSAALLPIEGRAQLRASLQQDRAAFKPKLKAQQPARNPRRPLGSLRSTRPRRKWRQDDTQLVAQATALLMSPAQSFHPSTGTISTGGQVIIPDERFHGRIRRDRTLTVEDAAWHHLGSKDSTDIVQRANGLGSQPSGPVWHSTISGMVTLSVPGDKLERILTQGPQPGAATASRADARDPSPSEPEGPPPEPRQKRRYKSRARKKARLNHDEALDSDDEFVPGVASPKEDLVLQTPARTRIARGGTDLITRDRHSGPAFKDADRLIVAIALVSAVCGGINQDRLNWGLVAHALSFRYEGEFLRRRWSHYSRFRKAEVDALRDAILEPFLEAYESGVLPRVNFQDLGNTDWPTLLEWVRKTIPLAKQVGSSEVPDLPCSRDALQKQYNLSVRDSYDQDKNLFFTVIADQQRKDLAVKYVHGIALPGHSTPSDEHKENSMLAKSWIRAVAMTRQSNYDMAQAARKVAPLGAQTLERLSAELVECRVFVQAKKNRVLPGRNFDIHHDVFNVMKRWPSTNNDDSGYLRAVAEAWYKLNEYFKTQDHLQLIPVASNHNYLVLTNMCAQGFLRVKPVIPEPTHDVKSDGPMLSPWGYSGHSYETKKADQSVLKYELVYSKTPGYKYHPELDPNVPIPREPAVVPGERGPRIPLWMDIHGNLVDEAWDAAVRSVLHLLVYRPGMTAHRMEGAHLHKLWAWEVEMVLGWMEKAGIAKRCGSGHEVEGVWKGGWRAGSWWYCTFLPEMAKWEEPTGRP